MCVNPESRLYRVPTRTILLLIKKYLLVDVHATKGVPNSIWKLGIENH